VRNIGRQLRTRVRYLVYDGRFRRRALIVCGGVLALGLLWIVITGLLARQQARQVESSLSRVRTLVAAGRIDDARVAAEKIPGEARRAHLLTSGPAWWLAGQIPYLGAPAETVRGATSAALTLGQNGIPDLLQVAKLMDPTKLRLAGNHIDIAAMQAASPKLDSAAAVLRAAAKQVDGLPTNTWLSAVDGPRLSLASQLHSLSGYVDAAARAARIMPTMLGADGPKRYFIGMQNEAESRGTGGLPGAFAIVEANNGTVKFTHFESDAALLPAATNKLIKTGLNFGSGYNDVYGESDPTISFPNSNVSPSFPYTAQIWAKMWEQMSGEHIDGAIAVDPTVLAYILSATGPVTLPSGDTVTAGNIITLTERDEYTLFSDNNQRKAFVVAILKATSNKLISGAGSATTIAKTMVAASNQQRLQVWSADPPVEKEIASTSYGATLPSNDRPLAAPVLNNISGGKLDFYLIRTITYNRSGCGSTRDVLVTLTFQNNAPATGLPTYVTGRLDTGIPENAIPGDYAALLDYYATPGAQLLSVTLNGQPSTASLKNDLGHPIFRMTLELMRGQTQTVVLHLREPPGTGSPKIWLQPGVSPTSVRAFTQPC
jgi:hypothetical protein